MLRHALAVSFPASRILISSRLAWHPGAGRTAFDSGRSPEPSQRQIEQKAHLHRIFKKCSLLATSPKPRPRREVKPLTWETGKQFASAAVTSWRRLAALSATPR